MTPIRGSRLHNSVYNILLYYSAVLKNKTIKMNISNQNDSSSILGIGKNQIHYFPDTYLKKKEVIKVTKLKELLDIQ